MLLLYDPNNDDLQFWQLSYFHHLTNFTFLQVWKWMLFCFFKLKKNFVCFMHWLKTIVYYSAYWPSFWNDNEIGQIIYDWTVKSLYYTVKKLFYVIQLIQTFIFTNFVEILTAIWTRGTNYFWWNRHHFKY